jgi:sulfatase modifying factor 1
MKNFVILLSSAVLITSCGKLNPFKKKPQQSDVTGWNYNDKNMGGYQVAKSKTRQQARVWYSFRVVPLPWVKQKKI